MPENAATYAAILTLVTGLIASLATNYNALRKGKFDQKKEERKDILAEYDEYIDRLQEADRQRDKVVAALKREKDQVTKELIDCTSELSSASERILVYEDLLAVHNIPVQKWKPRTHSKPSFDVVSDDDNSSPRTGK